MVRFAKPAWIAIAILGAAVNATASTQDVGSLEKVARNVYGTPPQASRTPQHPGDGVAFQELLETLEDSGAQIRFIDGSQLTIGSKSKVLVDQFVFDPGSASGNALISITSGALRFATGSMPKGKTVIDTPTATLTLRGTVVRVGVGPNGETELAVDAGSVGSHNKLTNGDQEVPSGDSVTISGNGFAAGTGDVGDTFVDEGFDAGDKSNPGIEQRRGTEAGGKSDSSSSSGNSGRSANGGPTGSGPRGN